MTSIQTTPNAVDGRATLPDPATAPSIAGLHARGRRTAATSPRYTACTHARWRTSACAAAAPSSDAAGAARAGIRSLPEPVAGVAAATDDDPGRQGQ